MLFLFFGRRGENGFEVECEVGKATMDEIRGGSYG